MTLADSADFKLPLQITKPRSSIWVGDVKDLEELNIPTVMLRERGAPVDTTCSATVPVMYVPQPESLSVFSHRFHQQLRSLRTNTTPIQHKHTST